jgi:hypothetical protein
MLAPRWPFATKIALVLTAVLVPGLLVLAYTAETHLHQLKQRLSSVYTDAILPLTAAHGSNHELARMREALRTMVISPDTMQAIWGSSATAAKEEFARQFARYVNQ